MKAASNLNGCRYNSQTKTPSLPQHFASCALSQEQIEDELHVVHRNPSAHDDLYDPYNQDNLDVMFYGSHAQSCSHDTSDVVEYGSICEPPSGLFTHLPPEQCWSEGWFFVP